MFPTIAQTMPMIACHSRLSRCGPWPPKMPDGVEEGAEGVEKVEDAEDKDEVKEVKDVRRVEEITSTVVEAWMVVVGGRCIEGRKRCLRCRLRGVGALYVQPGCLYRLKYQSHC
jgi:hypothetical protein